MSPATVLPGLDAIGMRFLLEALVDAITIVEGKASSSSSSSSSSSMAMVMTEDVAGWVYATLMCCEDPLDASSMAQVCALVRRCEIEIRA